MRVLLTGEKEMTQIGIMSGDQPEETGLDLLWGATPIGKALGLNPRQAITCWNLAWFPELARSAADGALVAKVCAGISTRF
jgi:hypothetical protein